MNGLRLFRTDDPIHRSTAELLPWYLTGNLEAEERRGVEAHLAQCPRCRRELESLHDLRAVIAADEAERNAVDYGLARTLARIDQLESPPRPGTFERLRGTWRRAQPWVRRLLVSQLALALVVGFALIAWQREPVPYRTLGAASPPQTGTARLSIVAAGGASEGDLVAVLDRVGGRIVEERAGSYVVEVADARAREALLALRASPVVRAAERMP